MRMGGIKMQLRCHMGSPKAADRLWNRMYWSALYCRRTHSTQFTFSKWWIKVRLTFPPLQSIWNPFQREREEGKVKEVALPA